MALSIKYLGRVKAKLEGQYFWIRLQFIGGGSGKPGKSFGGSGGKPGVNALVNIYTRTPFKPVQMG